MKKNFALILRCNFVTAVIPLILSALSVTASEVTLIPLGTTNRIVSPQGSTNWHYRIGSSEASSPIAGWRTNTFVEDGTWSVGNLPLGYPSSPANDPNNYEANLITTVPTATTCVYVRKAFVIPNRFAYSVLTVNGFADDGVVVWLNGRELTPRFQCCTGGSDANAPTFDVLSPTALESLPFTYMVTNDASGPLVDGTNILAIQLINNASSSSDLVLDASLTATLAQTNLLAPGYSIVGVAATAGSSASSIATVGTAAGVNNYPSNESPPNSIDANTGSKYLNFARINCGFIVTIPSSIATVEAFKFTTANDAPERDPLTVTLEGTTASDATTAAGGASWVTIYSGPSGLATDPGRLTVGGTVSFANSGAFNTYRMLITDTRTAAANSMQFSEIQFLGQFVADTNPPTLVSFSPPAGTVQAPVNSITVRFSEPVAGVDASDLVVNGSPATGVSGSGSNFVFTFPPLPFGVRHVEFASGHGITDFGSPANPFNATSAAWDYNVVDTIAPTIVNYLPITNTVVRSLTGIEVIFSEEVTGVDANDLLINGVPATGLVLGTPGQYAFTFPQPATGVVQVAWASGHGITDLAPVPNNFGGGAWTYTLDPNFSFDVRINEFMADNENGIRDEDGTHQDWLELYNATATSVNLAGWSLSDESGNLGKWHFPPNTIMQANSYLLVWCSNKDRTNNIAALHTNFKLAKDGGFLALVMPDGTNIVSSFAPYPAQRTDVSYGRDRVTPSIVGFYNTPTPNAQNSLGGPGDFTSDVVYSYTSRTFVTPFNLTLSTASTNAVIRYVLVTTAAGAAASVTNVPTTNSPIYTGAIPVSVTTEVRARAFETGKFPSTPRTESYIQIDSAVRNFSSDIPVVVVHMLGNGSIPVTTTTASGILMAFDNDGHRSSVTNGPQMASRMGIHARGSSTLGNPKTNMRIETWDEFNQDADYPLLGMPADSDWVLYGINQFDPGLMHNAIYQWLGRQLGIFNMRTRYVEVFNKLNNGPVTMNDYFGLYLLLETPKVGDDRVDIAKIHDQDTNSTAITGGYIFKIDRLDNEANFTPPTIGSIAPTPAPIVYTDPAYRSNETDPRRLAQIAYLRNYILNFLTNLAGASFTNPVTGYSQYIDTDEWIDHLLANIIPFNVDGYRLSGFMYKDRNGRLEQGPMWDCDRCMGTGGTTTPNADNRCFSPRYWRLPTTSQTGDNGTDFFGLSTVGVSWFSRLFRDPDFWQKWIDRYQAVRTNEYSTNAVFAVLDGWHAEIKEAQVREQARWGVTNPDNITTHNFTWPRSGVQTVNGYTFDFGPADNNGRGRFSNEVAFQKQWFADRFNFLDTNFLNMPTMSHGTTLLTNGATVTVTPATKAGSLLLYTLDGTDPRLPGGAVAPFARTNAGALSLTITNNIRVFARSYNVNHANVTNAGSSLYGNPLINSFWSGPVAATYYTEIPSLRVSELMYHPAPSASIFDTNDPDNFEYIELQNIGTNSLNLIGFRFLNGIDFTFTATNGVTNLGPGQFVLIVKNVNSFFGRYGLHTNVAGAYGGNLDNAGERITLVGPQLEPILDFTYSDEWYPFSDGLGMSLVILDPNAPLNTWSNKLSWRASAYENGSAGDVDPAPLDLPVVLVNEALTHTDPPSLDTIELFNPGTNDVNIGGWYLTDDGGSPKKYQIPPDTMIPAGGFLLFNEDNFNAGGPNSFSLSSSGDELFLFSATNGLLTGYAHGFDFAAAQNGVAFGRYVNSQGNEDFVAQSTTNTFLASNAPPLVGPIVISEIMYHPPGLAVGTNIVDNSVDEFIELQNISTNTVLLYGPTTNTANTWKLDKAVTFTFPTNVSIAPTSFVLVVNFDPNTNLTQLAAFRNRFGVANGIPIFGPYGGKLDNGGANIHLSRPDNPNSDGSIPYILVDRVQYDDSGAWPEAADGLGASLQRVVSSAYGNDPTNWTAARASAGVRYQGGAAPLITQQPTDATVLAATPSVISTFYSVGTTNFTAAVNSATDVSIQWRFNGIAIPDATNAVLTLTGITTNQAGYYSYLALNSGGTTFSSNALLTVLRPVGITIPPTNQNVQPGATVTLVSQAAGTGTIRYQWRFEGTNLLNATNSTYTFTNANLFEHHGNFSVVASDDISQIVSADAFIYVLVKPFVTVHITSQSVLQGQNATFSLVATGAPPLWYRWIRNGGSLQGATTSVPVLTITNVQFSQTLRCAVTNVALPSSGTGAFSPGPAAGNNVNLIMLADADGDGMWDIWETNYFGSSFGTNFGLVLPGADADGDGMSNVDEYRSGTNPTNALSVLKIVMTATNANLLEFVAQTNLTYSVQSRTNLGTASWNTISNIALSPTVRTIQVNTATSPFTDERYYRVVTPRVP